MGAAGRAGDIVADTGTDGDVFFIALWTNKLQFFQTKQDFLALAIFDVAISLMGIKSHNHSFPSAPQSLFLHTGKDLLMTQVYAVESANTDNRIWYRLKKIDAMINLHFIPLPTHALINTSQFELHWSRRLSAGYPILSTNSARLG